MLLLVAVLFAVVEAQQHFELERIDDGAAGQATALRLTPSLKGHWLIVKLADGAEVISTIRWCKMNIANADNPPDIAGCTADPQLLTIGVLYPSIDGVMRVRRPADERDTLIIDPVHVQWDDSHQIDIVVESETTMGVPQQRAVLMRQVVRFNVPGMPKNHLIVMPSHAVSSAIVHQSPSPPPPPLTTRPLVVVETTATPHVHAPHHWVGVLVVFVTGMSAIGIVGAILYSGLSPREWVVLVRNRLRRRGSTTANVSSYRFNIDDDVEASPGMTLSDNDLLARLGTGANAAFKLNAVKVRTQ